MKPFTSASLAEVGVFAIRQTLRIIREFEDDPNTAVRQTIDAETKKIRVAVMPGAGKSISHGVE